MYQIFGIPNCDTVKKARTFLEKHSVAFNFIDFKKNPPTRELIENWEKSFGGLPVNTKGTTYKKYKDEYEKLDSAAKKLFLIEHSSMIKRPILQKGNKVLCFGFNEEEYSQRLSK
jgi:arsenate reductase (glutaredoxin)